MECSHCSSRLTLVSSAAGGGAYYSCARCDRIYASAYHEVLEKNAGVRPASDPRRAPTADARFEQVKQRLEAFLRRLDEEDPWYVLGIAPGTSMERVRSRYRELALLHHPDRGGESRQMQRIAWAFEAIRSGHATPSPGERGIKPPPVDDTSREAVAVPAGGSAGRRAG